MNLKYISIVIIIIVFGGVLVYASFSGGPDEDLMYSSDQVPQEAVEQNNEESVTINRDDITMTQATLKTSKGEIVLEFYPDLAPNTVKNFQDLAKSGFYNGVIFHRVIENFMIQGGDPTGTGRGGPGYTFDDEFDRSSEVAQRGYVRGTLAMANSGPNSNGSQFFIVHQDAGLPYDYTIFGRVVEGMDVVDSIATTETGQNDKPIEDIVINEVVVSED